MSKFLNWLLLLIIAIFPSCGSNDEPEQPYMGPWEVYYYESYYGLHNDSPEFVNWFELHNQFFYSAMFINGNSQWMFDATSDRPMLKDYAEWYEGNITWIEIVGKATEEDVKVKVDSFESLSIPKDKNGRFDSFKASYRKYNAND